MVIDIFLAFVTCIAFLALLEPIYSKKRPAIIHWQWPKIFVFVALFRLLLFPAVAGVILMKGDVGRIIGVVGGVAVSGGYGVGIVVFLGVMVIAFVAAVRGTGRIPEIAARFTLDAMPGKQMAIDFDLNSGLINEARARERRQEIERELDFYSAVDYARVSACKLMRIDLISGFCLIIVMAALGPAIDVINNGVEPLKALAIWAPPIIGAGLVFQVTAAMLAIGTGMKIMACEKISLRKIDITVGDVSDIRWYTDAIAANSNETHFTISAAAELAALARLVGNGNNFSGKTITLAADINLSAYDNWGSIGNWNYPFSGTFDGGGHVISKLNTSTGLFGIIENGRVENLGLESVNVLGGGDIGGVAGSIYKNSTIINCYSGGIVDGSCRTRGGGDVGGVVGSVDDNSTVADCYSTCNVSGYSVVGGIAGRVGRNSSVTNCYSTGAINGTDIVGGIVGLVCHLGSVTNCTASNIRVKTLQVGRVAGSSNGTLSNNIANAEMANCYGYTAWHNKGADNLDGEDAKTDGRKDG